MQGRDIAITVVIVVLVLLLVGVGGGLMGWGMMGYWGLGGTGFGWGWWIPMALGMILFWGLVIGGIVWLVTWLTRQGHPAAGGIGPERPRAIEILQERYARGEITREQYEQMRRDIEEG